MNAHTLLRVLLALWMFVTPAVGVTSVLAWDVEVCGQTCNLAASVRSTLINDASESVRLQHPSRDDVVIDLDLQPLFKRVDLFFNFHRNFSNLYEQRNDQLNCMYSSEVALYICNESDDIIRAAILKAVTRSGPCVVCPKQIEPLASIV